jgi:hypothetical protein
MTIREIFVTNTRGTILLRGVIAVAAGLTVATIISITSGTNAFRRFAFPIFIVPLMLTTLHLLGTCVRKSQTVDPKSAKPSQMRH